MSHENHPRIFLSPPHMGGAEETFVGAAFASNYIAPVGPMVEAFEQEFAAYTGFAHCLALNSGTAAMHLALREILATRPGGNSAQRPLVLASTLTFIGSVSPATFESCDITFIDADRETWNMDPALLEAELAACAQADRLPAAVIPTDLYGQCCNLSKIVELCDRYGVPVICDSAEAVGARHSHSNGSETWHHAGYGARAAVYSFNGNKIITTSGGGMLASDDGDMVAHARKLATQAREPFPHYEHAEVGYNYRMSNIVAAIGRGQLQVADDRVAQRRRIFSRYRERLADLPGLAFMPEATHSRANRWLTVILLDPGVFGAGPRDLLETLEADRIEARPLWKPMHLQPVFTPGDGRYRTVGGDVAEDLFSRGLCLPSGTAMTDGDIERVAGAVRRCARAPRRKATP